MPNDITTEDALNLHRGGAQFVEVLGRSEYDEEHLPGAIHLPLGRIDERATEVLDRGRPVVVYCWDYQ